MSNYTHYRDHHTQNLVKRQNKRSEMDKINRTIAEIDKIKEMDTQMVQQQITWAIDRDKLEDLDDKAQNLTNEASIFNKRAKQTRIHFCLQQWKMIALIAVILIILILIIVLIFDKINSD
eukprot:864629_1